MLRSIDIAKREGITNPRKIDWNVVIDEWKWNEEKQRYVSVEFHFNGDLHWEKQVVTRKEIDTPENF